MKSESGERKLTLSDIRWYGIASYIKEVKRKPKSNEGVSIEYPETLPVEMPDHLGTKINILM